ncbi:MAG: 50S ribosomal protein L22 [Omnitrophica WOR_2 bacterium GWF2_38_59]|nr:MAG: 50S ribosomal protein L22 [Omnitrophica WOR_2 bacterium GWA2_37_7]OGX25237.1 MAG: 50S ribosomal protein L22 [Omnitrophica WOR_2 bacterium GWF2_38_59]OGX47909.1 MAG: 50S ribosomal protein L22 [Omnitrophica WOR_2 bacterium RIFOXYA2_FULL_38_17]OGX54163.1 MAG: 50S ribosomal protein L22 [Omnitrophica WOR_2 bacterium RIFOXYA12_FULL_38_10]OGX56246.1 MAG: 50S ribosomal protein L22 [Omnitrophica WOR_2 bacterium RIFOXYC2_FULL_38_12]OGX60249.1 MAG: 50S ribosomal protein L22 [Omnitrophica WOR_2 ba
MIAQAKGSYIRVSPIKVRQVIDLIRGKKVSASLAILAQTNKGQTGTISKILISAISNAKQKGLMEDQLYISKIKADQGPSWKRFRPAAFGRATRILKKTTHLLIELDLITK